MFTKSKFDPWLKLFFHRRIVFPLAKCFSIGEMFFHRRIFYHIQIFLEWEYDDRIHLRSQDLTCEGSEKKKNISMTKIKATLFLCLEARIILDSHENWYEQSISSLWKTTKWIMRFFERIYSIEQRLLETSVFFEAMFYSSSLRTVRNYLAKWFFCKKLKYERIHIPKEEKRNPKTIMTQKKEKKFINWII